MKKGNIIQEKSFAFAAKISRLCFALQKEHKEYVLTRQLLKSGTSIGANVEEAIGGQSRKDFYAKLTISYKEAGETHYWIRLMAEVELIDKAQKNELLAEVDELLKIIGSIQKTLRSNS
jgi:four helix bundle protein